MRAIADNGRFVLAEDAERQRTEPVEAALPQEPAPYQEPPATAAEPQPDAEAPKPRSRRPRKAAVKKET